MTTVNRPQLTVVNGIKQDTPIPAAHSHAGASDMELSETEAAHQLAELIRTIAVHHPIAEIFVAALWCCADEMAALIPAPLDGTDRASEHFLDLAARFVSAITTHADATGPSGALTLLALALAPHTP